MKFMHRIRQIETTLKQSKNIRLQEQLNNKTCRYCMEAGISYNLNPFYSIVSLYN